MKVWRWPRGLSADDEPDIWQKSLSGELDVWVSLGLPSEKVVRQSCSKAQKVTVYPYGGRTAEIWWEKIKGSTLRFGNLEVVSFSKKESGELASLANRTMKPQVNIHEGEVMVSADDKIVYAPPRDGATNRIAYSSAAWMRGFDNGPLGSWLPERRCASEPKVHEVKILGRLHRDSAPLPARKA